VLTSNWVPTAPDPEMEGVDSDTGRSGYTISQKPVESLPLQEEILFARTQSLIVEVLKTFNLWTMFQSGLLNIFIVILKLYVYIPISSTT
jgi:hypothetical protein